MVNKRYNRKSGCVPSPTRQVRKAIAGLNNPTARSRWCDSRSWPCPIPIGILLIGGCPERFRACRRSPNAETVLRVGTHAASISSETRTSPPWTEVGSVPILTSNRVSPDRVGGA